MALCDEIQHCVAGRAADFIEEALLGWTDETSRHGYAIPRIRGWRTWKNLARAGPRCGHRRLPEERRRRGGPALPGSR